MTNALPARRDVPKEKQWDIDDLFPTLAAWESAFADLDPLIDAMAQYQERLGESADVLFQATEALMEVCLRSWRVGTYARMLRAADAGDQDAMALVGRVSSRGSKLSAAIAFYDPELLAITDDELADFLAAEPRLSIYKHYFDSVRRMRPHTRSTEVESVLAQTLIIRNGPGQIFKSIVDADLKFAEIATESSDPLSVQQGTISGLLEHSDRAVRKAAWESYADGYLGMKNSLATCLVQSYQARLFGARTRHYDTVLDAVLTLPNIPRSVHDNLIAAFTENLPIWHRYWRLMRKALKVDALHVYDTPLTNAPASIAGTRRVVTWDDAVSILCDSMEPLGDEYVSVMRRGLTEERWVDAWPNQGKGSGAFSGGAQGSRPFIMMNWKDDIQSLSTLAHEIGHSMHSYFTWKHQHYVYVNYGIFVAETASNFNQAMVRAHLLSTSSDRESRLQILDEAFSNFFRYLFVMPTLARFEFDCYTKLESGGMPTADTMSASIVSLFREAFGDAVVIDEPRLGITWAEFSHLYIAYYPFQYATGISAANALARGVLSDGQPASSRYLSMLKSGGSMYPLETLKLAGIDMESTEPVQAAFQVLSSLVDELESLIG